MVTPVWYRGSLPQSSKRPPAPPCYGAGGRTPGTGGAQRMRPLGGSWELREDDERATGHLEAERRLCLPSKRVVGLERGLEHHVDARVVLAHALGLALVTACVRRVHVRKVDVVHERVVEGGHLPPQPVLGDVGQRGD